MNTLFLGRKWCPRARFSSRRVWRFWEERGFQGCCSFLGVLKELTTKKLFFKRKDVKLGKQERTLRLIFSISKVVFVLNKGVIKRSFDLSLLFNNLILARVQEYNVSSREDANRLHLAAGTLFRRLDHQE